MKPHQGLTWENLLREFTKSEELPRYVEVWVFSKQRELPKAERFARDTGIRKES